MAQYLGCWCDGAIVESLDAEDIIIIINIKPIFFITLYVSSFIAELDIERTCSGKIHLVIKLNKLKKENSIEIIQVLLVSRLN